MRPDAAGIAVVEEGDGVADRAAVRAALGGREVEELVDPGRLLLCPAPLTGAGDGSSGIGAARKAPMEGLRW